MNSFVFLLILGDSLDNFVLLQHHLNNYEIQNKERD